MRYHLSLILLIFWSLVVILSYLVDLSPNQINLSMIMHGPGGGGIFGSDDLGRSLLDRLVVGARASFVIAFVVVFISVIIGVMVGATSAYLGGKVDSVVVRVIDVFLAFPGILLAIAIAGLMGPGFSNVVIALCAVGWVGYARLTRGQILSIKQKDHVQAAVSLGSKPIKIIGAHLFPFVVAPLVVEATFGVAGVIIAEAGLSFLGLGVQPPDPSWGSMIRDGARYLLVAPHMVVVPGVALMSVVLAINLFGDGLRDRLDVRSR